MSDIYFSKSSMAFYDSSLFDVDSLPKDKIKISSDVRESIFKELMSGKILSADANGAPSTKESVVLKNLTCTPTQGLLALFHVKNISEDDIHSAIDGIDDPVEKYTAQIAFKHAITWERGSASTKTMASLLNLSSQNLDDLFTYAQSVQV